MGKKRPPRLSWYGGGYHADQYMVQSEIIRGEPRVYYAQGPGLTGPSRPTLRAAQIDAEYHAAGRTSERPKSREFTL